MMPTVSRLAFGERQLIRRNPPRLVFGKYLGRRTPAGLFLVIDTGELLPFLHWP